MQPSISVLFTRWRHWLFQISMRETVTVSVGPSLSVRQSARLHLTSVFPADCLGLFGWLCVCTFVRSSVHPSVHPFHPSVHPFHPFVSPFVHLSACWYLGPAASSRPIFVCLSVRMSVCWSLGLAAISIFVCLSVRMPV